MGWLDICAFHSRFTHLPLNSNTNGTIRLRALAAEVTRVTLEVGSQGKLGGQAHVPDVEGVWFELVRNVCFFSLILSHVLGRRV